MQAQNRSYKKWYSRNFAQDLQEEVDEIKDEGKVEDEKMDLKLEKKRRAREKNALQKAQDDEDLRNALEYERKKRLDKYHKKRSKLKLDQENSYSSEDN